MPIQWSSSLPSLRKVMRKVAGMAVVAPRYLCYLVVCIEDHSFNDRGGYILPPIKSFRRSDWIVKIICNQNTYTMKWFITKLCKVMQKVASNAVVAPRYLHIKAVSNAVVASSLPLSTAKSNVLVNCPLRLKDRGCCLVTVISVFEDGR